VKRPLSLDRASLRRRSLRARVARVRLGDPRRRRRVLEIGVARLQRRLRLARAHVRRQRQASHARLFFLLVRRSGEIDRLLSLFLAPRFQLSQRKLRAATLELGEERRALVSRLFAFEP